MEPTKCAYGYILMAISKKDGDGITYAEQESRIREWMKQNEMTCMGIYADSGAYVKYIFDRPMFMNLLSRIAPGNVMVFNDSTRVARKPAELKEAINELVQSGIRGVFVKDGVDTSEMDQEDIDTIGKKGVKKWKNGTKDPRLVRRSRYGWIRIDDNFVQVPEEQAVIREIFRLRDEVRLSFDEIARELWIRGIRCPSGAWVWNKRCVMPIYNRENIPVKGWE